MVHRELLIGLNMISGLGPKRISALAGEFASFEEFMNAGEKEIAHTFGIGNKLAKHINAARNRVNPFRESEKAVKHGVRITTIFEDEYPRQLREIYDPPPVLYTLGNFSLLEGDSIAIVGARKASVYGKNVASKLAGDLVTFDINVVSGMAKGIDTSAHKGAINAGGNTIAIWGSGMDVVYPYENKTLAHEISQKGCIVTCFPFGQKPVPGNFPARNRIISGLSLGVLVVEAADKSGSLITADFALEQGREVFAIPGSIFSPYSKGSHKIIKLGAKLVESVDDILDELYIPKTERLKAGNNDKHILLSDNERDLLGQIDFYPIHIEEIINKTGKLSREVNVILTQLELKGAISLLASGYVMRI